MTDLVLMGLLVFVVYLVLLYGIMFLVDMLSLGPLRRWWKKRKLGSVPR